MGFDWSNAAAGLLGEYGNQSSKFVQRQQELEEKKKAQDIADRKEAAALAKQQALLKFQYDKMDSQEALAAERQKSQETMADKRLAAQEALADKRAELQNSMLDKRMTAQESAAERRHQESLAKSDKESKAENKLSMIENDPNLSPEEKVAARKAVYGISDKKKGALSEAAAMKAEEHLAEIEGMGLNDTTMKQANAIRKALDMPLLTKVEKTPGRAGILGIGSKKPEYEYIEDYSSADNPPVDDTGKSKQSENKSSNTAPTGKNTKGNSSSSGLSLDKAKEILLSGTKSGQQQTHYVDKSGKSTPAEDKQMMSRADEIKAIKASQDGGILSSAGVDEVAAGGKKILSGAIQGAKTGLDIYSALIGQPFVNGVNAVLSAQEKTAAIGTLEAKFKQGVISEDEFNKAYSLINGR